MTNRKENLYTLFTGLTKQGLRGRPSVPTPFVSGVLYKGTWGTPRLFDSDSILSFPIVSILKVDECSMASVYKVDEKGLL